MSCVGMMVGAGLASVCAWPMVAVVVAGAVSAGLACTAAACYVDGSARAWLTAASAGFGLDAGFDASGLGFGSGTLRLASFGTEAGGRGPLPMGPAAAVRAGHRPNSARLVTRAVLPGWHEAQDAARARVDDESAVFAAAVDHGDGVDQAALLRDTERRKAGFADEVSTSCGGTTRPARSRAHKPDHSHHSRSAAAEARPPQAAARNTARRDRAPRHKDRRNPKPETARAPAPVPWSRQAPGLQRKAAASTHPVNNFIAILLL